MSLKWRRLALAAGLAALVGQAALPALHGAGAHAPASHVGAAEFAAAADLDSLHADCPLCLARAHTRGLAKSATPAPLLDRPGRVAPTASAGPGSLVAPARTGRGPRAPPPLS